MDGESPAPLGGHAGSRSFETEDNTSLSDNQLVRCDYKHATHSDHKEAL